MRQYDLMLVLDPEGSWEDEGKQKKLVHGLFEGMDVTVEKVELLGKKTLSYPIKKHNEGMYLTAKVASPGVVVGTVERHAKQNSAVLRFLLTKKEKSA